MRSFVQILGVQIQRKRTHGNLIFKCRGTENAADFFKYRDRSPGSVLFKYSKTTMIDVCYSNTEEQQHCNCVIQIQRNSNAGIVLFKYRGTATLELCYSNTEVKQ